MQNEREIITSISDGDEGAFRILYKHYYALLRPVVAKYLDSGIEAEAEEILQQAFIKVWLNREKLPEIENIYGWIYRIAYREYLMAIRKRLNYEKGLQGYTFSVNEGSSVVQPADTRNLHELRQCVQEAVSSLAPQRKTIYELSRNEGLKIAEIAERLSISPQTVKNVLSIVLKIIKEHLIAKGFGPFTGAVYFQLFF